MFLFSLQAADEPAYLTVGTDVSAKYRGAFCEAKIKTVKRLVKVKVSVLRLLLVLLKHCAQRVLTGGPTPEDYSSSHCMDFKQHLNEIFFICCCLFWNFFYFYFFSLFFGGNVVFFYYIFSGMLEQK